MMKKTCVVLLLASLLAACAGGAAPSDGNAAEERPAQPPRNKLIRTDPETVPDWIASVPQSQSEIYFVGMSAPLSSEAAARDEARKDAVVQVSRFYGQFLQENLSVRSRYAEESGKVLADLTEADSDIAMFAQAVVTQINADSYFTEVYDGGKAGEVYVAYALCRIPRSKAEEDIRNFAKDVSDRYGNLITRQDSFITALNSYNHVLQTLERNPLHKAVAVYRGRNGEVNLYDFLVTEMNALASGVTFSPVTSSVKQNDESLDMTVRVASSYKTMGPLDVSARVDGAAGLRGSYLVDQDNTVKLSLRTGPLNRGRYTVVFEIPLKESFPVIRANPQGSYLFAVTSAAAGIRFEGSPLSAREQSSLAENIQQGIQRYNAPLKLVTQGAAEYVIVADHRTGSQQMPGTKFAMYSCTISLALVRGGTVILQSPVIKGDNGLSAGEAFGNTLAAMRSGAAFFQGIASSLDK
jgi:hypothetical protein